MIEYISGKIVEQTPTQIILENNEIGYLIHVSLITYSDVQNKENVRLYIFEAIREDAHTLYGFSSKKERDLFLLLISVSGVGASTARIILSSYSVSELIDIISTEKTSILNTVKGIGLKTAQRIIVDLKDKVLTIGSASDINSNGKLFVDNETKSEAISALIMLGYTSTASTKAVEKLLKTEPNLELSKIIKKSLQML